MEDDQERRLLAAIALFRAEPHRSIRSLAYEFKIPRSTLQDRLKGKRSIKTFASGRQRLTTHEEASIYRMAVQMASWGWPISIHGLRGFVEDLLKARGDYEPLGVNWYSRFLDRHPELKLFQSRVLDQARQTAANYQTLASWFDLYITTKLRYGIADNDEYNMDEKGVMKGIGDAVKVIIPRQQKTASSIQPDNREWVSIIECIGFNGYVLPPYIIFEGKQLQQSWFRNDIEIDQQTVVCCSPNGWTDSEIAVNWLHHFNHHTKARTQGSYRLLILDGHNSHTSYEFVKYCEEEKIIALCLPPHSTHLLQPLDVGIFGPLAKAYKTLIQRNSFLGAERITNADFMKFYHQARSGIAANIPGAWKGVGLHPFKPQRVLEAFRPKTPPSMVLHDGTGRKLEIPLDQQLGDRVLEMFQAVISKYGSPLKKDLAVVQDLALTAIVDNNTLKPLNQGLVDKQRKAYHQKERKAFGETRQLTLQQADDQKAAREAKELAIKAVKDRKKALRGQVGFAKLVWKELAMPGDIFDVPE
jgi:hypothetical protein